MVISSESNVFKRLFWIDIIIQGIAILIQPYFEEQSEII